MNKLHENNEGVSYMTVHFYYNYKEDLVKKLKDHYEMELKKSADDKKDQLQLDEAEKLIRNYFNSVQSDIEELEMVSAGEVKYEENEGFISQFTVEQNYIRFTRLGKTIEVKIGVYIPEEDIVESTVIANITCGDKKCKIKKRGKIHEGSSFDENTINYYMREAFGPLDI